MTDLYNELGGGAPVPDIMSELAPSKPANMAPISAIKQRAAALALMSKGGVVENYESAVQAVKDNRLEQTRIYSEYHEGIKSDTTKGLMSILSSPEYSFEEKRKAIEASKTPVIETSQRLAELGLMDDSPGESEEEEMVRVNTIGALEEVIRSRQDVQGMLNAHAASLNSEAGKAFFDFLATDILPFGNNVIQAQVAKAEGKGLWGVIKALALPGSARGKDQQAYFDIPVEKERELAEKLIKAYSNAGVLFPSDNHYAQLTKLQDVLSGTEPWKPGVILENVAPLLDVIGIRAEYKAGKLWLKSRQAERASELASKLPSTPTPSIVPEKPAGQAGNAVVDTKSVGRQYRRPDESLLANPPQVPDQAMARQRAEITALEAEKARLLEDQNLAGRGDIRNLEAERAAIEAPDTDVKKLADSIKKANPRMSSKDARREAQKRIDDSIADYNAKLDRIEQQIKANSGAAKTQQRIAELEDKIAILSKGVPENAGSVRTALSDEISRIEWNNLSRYDNPISPANILGSANPSKARSLFTAMVLDESGEVATAAYGSSKVDAIAANVFPQATTEAGAVTTKVPDLARDLDVNPEILSRMKPGALDFNLEELARADKNIKDKMFQVDGLYPNDAMGGVMINREGAIANISAVFGTKEGGFLTAERALEQARYALRDFGAKEGDFEILARDGMNHRPVSISDVAGVEGEYYVRFKLPYETKMNDVGIVDTEDVKWNAFDNVPILMGTKYTGSFTRNLVDVASMFTSRHVASANIADAKASGLMKVLTSEIKVFTDMFDSLPDARKAKLEGYLKEANANQWKDNPAYLVAEGFNKFEIDTIREFRRFQDTVWYMENSDFVRTLNQDNWKLLDHPTDEFVARELQPNQWKEVDEFYDPKTGNIEKFDDAQRININNSGGYLAELRRPTDINGTTVTHIFVDNNPSSYLRTIRESDGVLNKLDGYYSVYYRAPRFVDKITYGVDGKTVIRKEAVAVGPDWKTAENWANRQPIVGNIKYEVRGDERAMQIGSNDYVDIHSQGGRINQRHRGQPLNDSSNGPAILGDGDFVLGPVDSAVRSARSISGRIAGRSMLENAKARFIEQYKEFLTPDKFGKYSFPSSVDGIGKKGVLSTSEMADARSAWEHINYLENGYLNAADVAVRQMFNSAAIIVGKKGFSKTERALSKVGEISPMGAFKKTVFNVLVGSNILRNWVVQVFQVSRLPMYAPRAIPSAMKDVSQFVLDKLNQGLNPKGAKLSDFTKLVDESDLLATVDQNVLVKSSIENTMDHSNKVLRKLEMPIELARRVGFDTAEQLNLLSHLAVVYNEARIAGKNLADVRVREEIMAQARNLSGNMSRAGDMPYNQTALSTMLQFVQAPHKMLLQYTNRGLTGWQKLRLLAWDVFTFGVPSALIYNELVEEEIPDPEIRKDMVDGFYNYALNKMILKDKYGEDAKGIDISSLSPNNLDGVFELYQAVVTGGVDEMMTKTPGGSMFGENGRIQKAVRMWSQMFTGEDTDEQPNPVGLQEALTETLKILPLLNNAQKAALIVEYGERRNSIGIAEETGLPPMYAVAQAFGFGSKDLSDIYKESKKLSEATKANEDDLYKSYRQALQIMNAVNENSMSDIESRMRTANFMLAPYRNHPWAKKKLVEWLQRDMRGADRNLHMRLMKLSGVQDVDDIRRSIERHPSLTKEEKNLYIDRMKRVQQHIDSEEY